MKNWLRRRPRLPLYLPTLRKLKSKSKRRQPKSVSNAQAWMEQLYPPPTERVVGAVYTRKFLGGLLPLVLILGSVTVAWRMYGMQVAGYERYSTLADGNRIRETISYAPRGKIYDRNGQILADNISAFELNVTPFLLDADTVSREYDYERIATILGITTEQLRQQAEFFHGDDYSMPISIRRNLSHTQVLELMQIQPDLEGFSINESWRREYVADAGLAHIIGYTGAVNEQEVVDSNGVLLPIDYVGKSGVEASYDANLRGVNGIERTEVDTLGRPIRVLARRQAQPGKDIVLTIDIELQRRLASEIIYQMKRANVSRGSGVVIDAQSGEVLAMVSLPAYDNNLFARGITESELTTLTSSADQPLVNKVISGGYTVGSTIKPLVASAALQEQVVTPQTIIVDSGAISVTSQYQPGAAFIFRGWRPGGLGPMNVRSAIAWSSNIYFYTVGGGHGSIGGLGAERLVRYYRMFGLGELSGIDLPQEIAGRVPDPAWKLATVNEQWYVGDTYNISIGQGDLLVSPLQLTLANMAIANGGYVLQPRVVKSVAQSPLAQRTVKRTVSINQENLRIVREGMRQALTSGTTCDCVFKNVPVHVAGKTGTAQTTSDESRRSHAWFTAFAPYEQPAVMAAVMLEEGSGGSQFAAPAIAGVFSLYFNR